MERIIPDDLGPSSDLTMGHRFRYLLARGFLHAGDRVLDAACGVGYGSHVLAQVPGVKVTGYDYDESAIKYAVEHYSLEMGAHGSETRFGFMDLDALQVPEGEPPYDACISFETIEHLKNEPKVFADKLKKLSSRLIVVSAPIVPTVHLNGYHRHDVTEEQLINLFQDDQWQVFEKVKQRVYGVIVACRRDKLALMR